MQQFKLFPNPANLNIRVSGNEAEEELDYEIWDMSGSIVYTRQSGLPEVTLHIAELPAGQYICHVRKGKTILRSLEFIRE